MKSTSQSESVLSLTDVTGVSATEMVVLLFLLISHVCGFFLFCFPFVIESL